MKTSIQKWGNSQGLRIPRSVLEELQIDVGTQLIMEVREGSIVLIPVLSERRVVRLEDLLAKMPKEKDSPREIGWGKPVGREVW